MTSRAIANGTLRALSVAIVLIAITNFLSAEDAESPADSMRRAAELNSLDAASMEPWHLKISFQLFDAKGEAAETGTVEEWWKSPSLHKTVYTSPSYTSTEVQTADGLYRSKDASSPPDLLSLILQQVVHPISEKEIADAKPDLRKQDSLRFRWTASCSRKRSKTFRTLHWGYSLPTALIPVLTFCEPSIILALRQRFEITLERFNSTRFQ
jgi:hypothetical protein